eukprot:TRINITY_DN64436_c0_g1_i1.p1 TRINITY_DN64436_c0_g1~~TRINITY_DN64436_c0_g1_i1.p1  ORF type:complete len:249 (-),score=52.03 TRINITY_DN64436_c0_g1_i1:105-851(-)
MAGLKKHGIDANPFGSKFKDTEGGYDAGNGKRTYTHPSYTLFVTKIPDAESSDSVAQVFEYDEGFLQCRPVGHKARRMVFVDYDSISCATKGMQAHQGFRWEDVDEGLNIDYDKDARCKRNTALDAGHFEKFWPIGSRKAKVESDSELFARLKAESNPSGSKRPAADVPKAKPKAKAFAARLQIKSKDQSEERCSPAPAPEPASAAAAGVGLVTYDSSDSEDDPGKEQEDCSKRAKATRSPNKRAKTA